MIFTLKTPEAKGWRKSGDASANKGMRESVNFNDLIIKSSKSSKDKPVAPPAGYVSALDRTIVDSQTPLIRLPTTRPRNTPDPRSCLRRLSKRIGSEKTLTTVPLCTPRPSSVHRPPGPIPSPQCMLLPFTPADSQWLAVLNIVALSLISSMAK